MAMTIDTSAWSGEGEFTTALVEALKGFPDIDLIRVEDAPASRAGSGYNFLSNEIYVRFAGPVASLADLARGLAANPAIGEADYAEDMLQYLRTQRMVPPYQTRGIKLVEMVRVYEIRIEG
jgi:hypothetical protein